MNVTECPDCGAVTNDLARHKAARGCTPADRAVATRSVTPGGADLFIPERGAQNGQNAPLEGIRLSGPARERNAAPEPSDGPLSEPAGDAPEPEGADSPFYEREWRGGPLYRCPACGERSYFTARSHGAIIRHMERVHPEPDRSIETRARRAGIVLARR